MPDDNIPTFAELREEFLALVTGPQIAEAAADPAERQRLHVRASKILDQLDGAHLPTGLNSAELGTQSESS